MVAIKDFEMPNACYMCPILDGEYGRCKIIGEPQCDMTEERAKCCLLVESIPKEQYEARLKADMVAMLTDIQLEIEELDPSGNEWSDSLDACNEIIQQKINALKED